jgi:CubicO group peptidase (beta-lactamase class C family)
MHYSPVRQMRHARAWFIPTAVALTVVLASACGTAHPTVPDGTGELTPVTLTDEWSIATPSEAGLDAARMTGLVQRIRAGRYGRMTSLLVLRDDRLVVEEYFNGWSSGRSHMLQSVTKSVTALLTGIAVQRGQLTLDDRVTPYFPQYEPIPGDPRKRAITVGDLLTMRSGLDWDESIYAGSPLQRLNDCRCDWLRFVLDWPMRDAPGTRWEYISGNTILLGGLLGASTGERLDRFAATALFAPLRITSDTWARGLPDGLPHAGGGLSLRPRDIAKLGVLVLDEGRWQSDTVVRPDWIRLITSRVTGGVRTWAAHSFDYGYGWWRTSDGGRDVIAAAGAMGQWIFVVPSARLVMVATGDDDSRWTAALEFLSSDVLPSVTR